MGSKRTGGSKEARCTLGSPMGSPVGEGAPEDSSPLDDEQPAAARVRAAVAANAIDHRIEPRTGRRGVLTCTWCILLPLRRPSAAPHRRRAGRACRVERCLDQTSVWQCVATW
ncbi:hypothetical protein GCM10027586_00470 [Kineococcus gypseus]